MDKEKINAERHTLLQRLEDELQDNLMAAQLREKENPDDPDEPEVLGILLDELGSGAEEALGEICFRPLASEDDEIQYFTMLITFSDDLQSQYLPAVVEAASYINFHIPCGSFQVDMTHTFLCYRLAAPLPISLAGDALYEEMNLLTGNAVAIADQFFDILLDVSRGEASIDDVIIFLGGTPTQQ